MIIRKAEIADKENVLKLIYKFDEYYVKNHLFPNEMLLFVDFQDKEKTFAEFVIDFLSNPKYFTFVAEENGELIGYICSDVQEKEHRVINKEGFIEDWFVLEDYRGKGVGKKLYVDGTIQKSRVSASWFKSICSK